MSTKEKEMDLKITLTERETGKNASVSLSTSQLESMKSIHGIDLFPVLMFQLRTEIESIYVEN